MIKEKQQFSLDKAKKIGDALGIDWSRTEIEEFRRGLEAELEHGVRDPTKKITKAGLHFTGKIAWAHLNDNPHYYTRFD